MLLSKAKKHVQSYAQYERHCRRAWKRTQKRVAELGLASHLDLLPSSFHPRKRPGNRGRA